VAHVPTLFITGTPYSDAISLGNLPLGRRMSSRQRDSGFTPGLLNHVRTWMKRVTRKSRGPKGQPDSLGICSGPLNNYDKITRKVANVVEWLE
ncbi:hypothetical protein K0M31_008682, partial [Melipona bicolor]